MEEIFRRLSEIEAAADRIKEDTEQKKVRMSVESEKQMSEYDKKLAEKTDERISAIRGSLEKEKEERLSALTAESEKALQKLDAFYEANHKRLSKELYERIIR